MPSKHHRPQLPEGVERLTARQRNILDFVVEFQDREGFAPSIREIGNFFSIKSTNAVSDHLKALERKGYVTREGSQSRALRVLRTSDGLQTEQQSRVVAANDGEELGRVGPAGRTTDQDAAGSIRVPILGRVAAGAPLLAVADPNADSIALDPGLLGGARDVFALRVVGESMIEAGILPGDLVFVRRTQHIDNGQIAVVLIDGEATVKRVVRKGDEVHLIPENRTMTPLVVRARDVSALDIAGVVVGVFRQLPR